MYGITFTELFKMLPKWLYFYDTCHKMIDINIYEKVFQIWSSKFGIKYVISKYEKEHIHFCVINK